MQLEFWKSTGQMYEGSATSKLKHGRYTKLNDGAIASAAQMYESGMSLAQIAKHFNVSRQSIWKSLRRVGVQMRSQKRYGKENHFYRGGAKAVDSAQNKLEKAIQRGDIVRPSTCEKCGERPLPMKDGRTAIQAHHYDYSKPLEVQWLCQRCHHEEHKSA